MNLFRIKSHAVWGSIRRMSNRKQDFTCLKTNKQDPLLLFITDQKYHLKVLFPASHYKTPMGIRDCTSPTEGSSVEGKPRVSPKWSSPNF
jgi:hypothetical protein